MKKTKPTPKAPPEKKDRRGWPKGKPRKPKLSMAQQAAIAEKQEAIRKSIPNPDWISAEPSVRTLHVSDLPHGVKADPRFFTASNVQPGTYPPNMGETITGPMRAIASPHKLGAEWQFMDLDEWRRNPTCVEYLQKLRNEPMFRRFLGMLHGYASRNGVEAPQTETSASIALGKIQGRREILEVIDEAAQPDQPLFNPADLPAFADEGEPLGII